MSVIPASDILLKPDTDEPGDSPYCEEHCSAEGVLLQDDEDLLYCVKDPPERQVYCMQDPPE